MTAAKSLSSDVGRATACEALGLSRASFYRWLEREQDPGAGGDRNAGPPSHRALGPVERAAVLEALRSDRFVDRAPRQVYATLLDEGSYLCSVRTMYRILEAEDEVRERRNQRRHPEYTKPELLATGPNQVWSWDITKLKGPVKWTYFYLYVILDIFSRYVVGWMVASRELASLAHRLIEETVEKQGISRDELTLHSDRGPSMTSQVVGHLLADLGITKSLNRPHVSNDNPYSEAQFKTVKYSPGFPERFGCLEDARAYCRPFFDWYNNDHYHVGLGLLTPAMVHYDRAAGVREQRAEVLLEAYARNPERFVNGEPKLAPMPEAAWINPPAEKKEVVAALQ